MPASVVRAVGAAESVTRVEAVTVRRCVDIGGPVLASSAVSAPPAPVEPAAPPRTAPPEPIVVGRLIPMPCLVAGPALAGATNPSPASRPPAASSPAPSSPAASSAAPDSNVRHAAAGSAARDIAPESVTQPVAYAPPPPGSTAPAGESIPFVTAELVIMAPARRARPEPQLPVVMVRPSLVLPPEQLAHHDANALLMLTAPDVADFCVPQRAVSQSASTLPPLSGRTGPLPVAARTGPLPLSPRTGPLPELERERGSDAALEVVQGIAPWGWAVVLIAAFAVGILVTSAIIVNLSPTSCR